MCSVLSRANQLPCRVHLLQLLSYFSNTNITLAMKFWLVTFSLRIWQVTWNTWYRSRAYFCNQRHGLRNVLSLQRTIPYTPMNPEVPSSISLLRLFQPKSLLLSSSLHRPYQWQDSLLPALTPWASPSILLYYLNRLVQTPPYLPMSP